jgi:hypothetical protein
MSARSLRIAAGLIVVGALGACEFDRATVLSPLGDPSYDFALTSDGRGLPRGTVARVVPLTDADAAVFDTTYEVALTGLEPLTAGVYQVWLGTIDPDNPAEPSWTPAEGELTITRVDTTFTPEGDPIPDTVEVSVTSDVSAFTEGGPAIQARLVIDRASLGGVSPFDFNTVLVSLEAAPGAAQPSTDARPIWSRATGGTGSTRISVSGVDTMFATVTTTQTVFGNFGLTTAEEYRFTATGRGRGGIRGNIMIVDDSALARPPVGYYYATWVVRRDDTGSPIDTLVLGEQTAPFPDRSVSLRDADISLVHPVVLDFPMSILAASSRIEVSGASPFLGYEDVWVTLENKLGEEGTAAPSIVLSGVVPEIISAP